MGKIKVSINELDKLEKLSYGWDVVELISDAIMRGQSFIYLDHEEYENIKKKHLGIIINRKNEAYYWELKENAIQFEKDKNFDFAVKSFEDAFRFAIKNNLRITLFAHGFDRLIVNYRKTKQKQKEIEALRYMIENYRDWNHPTYHKWNERLTKLI